MKRSLRVPGRQKNVCEGPVLGRSLANVGGQFMQSGWWAGEKRSLRHGQMVSGLVGHGKGAGAMGSYRRRALSGSWQRGSDTL